MVKFRTPVGIYSRKREKRREGERGGAENEVNTDRISQHNVMYFYDFCVIQRNLNCNKYSIALFFVQNKIRNM